VVEPYNVARQAFDRHEVGRFKAAVLAERLARRYGREVGYAVAPYDRELHAGLFEGPPSALSLLVGAVVNAAARRALAATLEAPPWYGAYGQAPGRVWLLDCGNGRNSGQVLLGNAARPEALRGAFPPGEGCCRALPAPGLQRPDLLTSPVWCGNLIRRGSSRAQPPALRCPPNLELHRPSPLALIAVRAAGRAAGR
jgi:hypothetical protein